MLVICLLSVQSNKCFISEERDSSESRTDVENEQTRESSVHHDTAQCAIFVQVTTPRHYLTGEEINGIVF